MPLEQALQFQLSTKLLEKRHPSVVGQGGVSKGELDAAEPFGHLTQSSPGGKIPQSTFCSSYYTWPRREIWNP
jgi:hypothetical protein